jgi:hypothetical protein
MISYHFDIKLPSMDGISLKQRSDEHAASRHAPLIHLVAAPNHNQQSSIWPLLPITIRRDCHEIRDHDSIRCTHRIAHVLLPPNALDQPSDEALSDQYQLTASSFPASPVSNRALPEEQCPEPKHHWPSQHKNCASSSSGRLSFSSIRANLLTYRQFPSLARLGAMHWEWLRPVATAHLRPAAAVLRSPKAPLGLPPLHSCASRGRIGLSRQATEVSNIHLDLLQAPLTHSQLYLSVE